MYINILYYIYNYNYYIFKMPFFVKNTTVDPTGISFILENPHIIRQISELSHEEYKILQKLLKSNDKGAIDAIEISTRSSPQYQHKYKGGSQQYKGGYKKKNQYKSTHHTN
jgi:hypothetical protein